MIGKRIKHYDVVERLGAGGMGVVYKATDTRLGRPVALKFLRPDAVSDAAAHARFLREARAASAIQHENICTIHEIDETDDGHVFICMDYYAGRTLRDRLTAGAMPVAEAVDIVRQVALGLGEAHARQVLHRDIKPANILITERGVAKLVDFGLATLSGETRVTKTGTAVGTVSYMSPERVLGEADTPASDVFSLGVVLFEALTGQLPFSGQSDGAVLYRIVNDEPGSLDRLRPDTPPALRAVVRRAIEKKPAARYADAGAFAAGLASALGESPVSDVGPESDAVESLAVLPFVNESNDPDVDYLSDGLTDMLIDNLCQIPRLKVMARATVFQYQNRDVTPQDVGRSLGVRAVLTGRMRSVRDDLVIRAELVDARDGTRLWGDRFRRPAADLLDIEEEISREISENLRISLKPEEKERLAKRRTESPEAHRAYLKGRHVWNLWKTPDGMRTAIGFFEQALEIDPLFALAFAGLADSHSMLGNVKAVAPAEAYPRAKTAALQGLAIDDEVAELHTSLGFVQRFWEWDWDAAEKSFLRAIELNPGYQTTYRFYGQLLAGLGRFDEAIEISSKSVELDPLSLMIRGALGDVYFYARRYDEAIALYEETIQVDPNFLAGRTDLARAYELSGRYDEAIEQFETAAALAPKGPPEPSSGLAHVYARMGEREKALEILEQLLQLGKRRYVSPYGIASIYACLNEVDKSIEWLERAYAEHDQTLVWVKVHPRLDPVRDDPRYHDLLGRMTLS